MEKDHSFINSKDCVIRLLKNYKGGHRFEIEHYIKINEESIVFFDRNVEKYSLTFKKIEGDKLFLKFPETEEKGFSFANLFLDFFDYITISSFGEKLFTVDFLSKKGSLLMVNVGFLVD